MSIQKKINKTLNSGYTYIEVLVSLLVISMLSALLFFSYSFCVRSIRKTRQNITSSIERLNFEYSIRKKINSVSIPYWLKDYELSTESNVLILNWVNGVNSLELIHYPATIKILKIEQITKKSGFIIGLKINYEFRGKEYEILELFASRKYGDCLL